MVGKETVGDYLHFIKCTHDAAKSNEESWDIPKQQEEIYVKLPIGMPVS